MKIKYLFMILILISCKKDKLDENKEILMGTWNWVYTVHSYGWCSYQPSYETLTSVTFGKNYHIEFLKKGKLNYYEDNKLVEKHRIVFNYFEQGSDGAYYFYLYLDNDLEKGLAGSIHEDTLHFDYPLQEENPDCENYLNFLVRE